MLFEISVKFPYFWKGKFNIYICFSYDYLINITLFELESIALRISITIFGLFEGFSLFIILNSDLIFGINQETFLFTVYLCCQSK